jgi:phospholipid-binding lipoprotein MlaA
MIRREMTMPATIRRIIIALFLALSLAGCATTTANLPPEVPAMHSVEELKDERVAQAPDSWEEFNRTMYNFNYRLDKYFLLPVVSGYEFITPRFVQKGVSNFFDNIEETRNLTNSIFQLKGMESLTTLGRFLTNSTIGIGGLFDVATPMGMPTRREDFGQTLGHWGCGPGPYLVLPLFGPSSARDGSGLLVDAGIRYAIVSAMNLETNIGDEWNTIHAGLTFLEAIDKRHGESFRYYGTEYPFEYDMTRYFYTKKREFESMK